MGFKEISIENYIELYLKRHPEVDNADIRKRLNDALRDYENGIKCSCGNDIWEIGSASVGNSCYFCITGQNESDSDIEIDSAIKKRENRKGQRHIDDMKPEEIHGFFDDDGYEINMDLIKKPSLCLTCVYNENPRDQYEELLCNMTRHDQKDEPEFVCHAYKKIDF